MKIVLLWYQYWHFSNGNDSVVPSVGVVPGEPTDVVVTEATKSYVVLAWKPPVQRGHEGVMYYIEKVRRTFCLKVFSFFFLWKWQ